jgi:hypothetical protein
MIKRAEPVESKFLQYYKVKWETELEEESVAMSEIAGFDESSVFAVAMTGKEGKIRGTFFYHLDAKTGKIKRKQPIIPNEPNTAFYFTKAHYDKEKQTVLLIGNLLGSELKKKQSFNVLNIVVFTVDLKTKEIKENTLALPDLSSFDYKPISFDEQFPVVRQISKTKRGDYAVSVEIMAKRDAIGRIVPVGLSSFSISGSGSCTSTGTFLYNIKEIAPIDGSQIYYKYHGTTADGKSTLISIIYKKQHYTRMVTFSDGAPHETTLAECKTNADTDDDLRELLLDDHTVLTVKKIEKDQWELKTHEF